MNNKLLLDFRENLIYNFFESTFYFEYKKIKAQNQENNIHKNIKDSQDIINDNFQAFLEEYDL
jgi:RecB family endonuclease NucS